MNNSKFPPLKGILISLALGLAMGALSGLSTFGLLAAPAFLGFALGAWGFAGGGIAFAAFAGMAWAVCGAQALPYALGVALPASAVIGYIIMKQKPWRVAVSLSALLLGLGLYAYICLPDILSGTEAFASVRSIFTALRDELAASANALGLASEAQSYFAAALTLYADMADQLAMELICSAAMLFALADTLLARALAKRAGANVRPMAPMPLWQLSRNYTYAAGAAILGAAVCLLAKLNNAQLVLTVAEHAVLGPLALTGLCYLDFSTRLGRPGSKAKRIIIYVLVVLLPYRMNVLAIIGLLDKIIKTRARFVPNKNRKK